MHILRLFGPLIFSCAAAGCGGGGGNDADSTLCRTISGGGTQVTFSSSAGCPGCSSANNPQGADNDFDTAATMQMASGGAGTIELRATAQTGIVYPVGSMAGLVFSITASSQAGFEPSIITYLNGTQQEVQQLSINGVGGGSGSKQKSTFRANRQFNAVALSIARAAATSSISSQAFEFCAE